MTHLRLVDEVPNNTFYWIHAAMGRENREVLRAIVKQIVQRGPRIRYGLRYEGDYFKNGDYIRRGLGNGLTCATFILAIFRSAGFELLKVAEWPSGRPGDLEFQTAQIRWLQQHFPDFIESEQQLHTGDPRYRPDEVAAAIWSNRIPLGFREAERTAAAITKALRQAAH